MKGDPAECAFLDRSPVANGIPPDVLAVQGQPHKATEVTLEIFASRLSQQHFAHAAAP